MTDHDVTDDDLRKARQWAEKVDPPHTNPGYSGTTSDIYNAARVILGTVPAPPKSLADEIREEGAGRPPGAVKRVNNLADRVDEMEGKLRDTYKALVFHIDNSTKCMAERDEARAEVTRLASIIKNHAKSESIFAPGGVIGKGAKENLDRMNTNTSRRVIYRADDLATLPAGSVVLDEDGNACQKNPQYNDWNRNLYDMPASTLLNKYGPVTVIYEPEATA